MGVEAEGGVNRARLQEGKFVKYFENGGKNLNLDIM